jgi:hypothetical protein
MHTFHDSHLFFFVNIFFGREVKIRKTKIKREKKEQRIGNKMTSLGKKIKIKFRPNLFEHIRVLD